ncbi:GFA family protein [Arenimonas oryziterrae]|nr:GFA family protein [Arenimonas oryziterrae]
MTAILHGSCHCGRLRIAFDTGVALADFAPRACDCAFCRKHGAAYISDPAGRLTVIADEGALKRYRQGSHTADFLICGECGVLVAVTFEDDGRRFGAVNAGCLDEASVFAAAVNASPQSLTAEQKVLRWRQLWIPDVVFEFSPR